MVEFGFSLEKTDRDRFLKRSFGFLPLDHFDRIIEFLDREDADLRRSLNFGLTLRAGRESPEVAAKQLAGMPESSEKEQLVGAIVEGWASSDHEAGYYWILETFDEPRRSELIWKLADTVSGRSPSDAAEYISDAVSETEDGKLSKISCAISLPEISMELPLGSQNKMSRCDRRRCLVQLTSGPK